MFISVLGSFVTTKVRCCKGEAQMAISHLSLTVVPGLCASVGALCLSFSAYSQELNGVAHQFLQRHGVPCDFVLKVGLDNLGQAAVCEDGRAWAMFWVENEIAFAQLQTGEQYKWDRQIYLRHPELYITPDSNFWQPYREP